MNYTIIPAALLITLVLTLLFAFFTGRRLRGLGVFFLLLFFATWSAQLWITPIGPVHWRIAWIPLIVVPLFLSVFILALLPPVPKVKSTDGVQEESAFIALGAFVWILIVLLLVSIVIGYYRSPPVIAGDQVIQVK